MSLLTFYSVLFLLTPGAAQIYYKQTNHCNKIWQSPSPNVVSFWKHQPPTGFYSLGDVGVIGGDGDKPTGLFVTVLDKSSDALTEPVTLEYVWDDRGSGVDSDITVYRMVPREGYACLGMIAHPKYKDVDRPASTNYRCVKEDYLTSGSSIKLWNDVDSSIYLKGSAWSIGRKIGSDGTDIQAFYFLTSTDNSFNPKVIRSSFLTPLTVVKEKDDALAVLELHLLPDLMWRSYSGIRSGSIHNPVLTNIKLKNKFHSLGSVLMMGHNAPDSIFLVKGIFGRSIAYPSNYTLLWNSKTTGSKINVNVWQPVCPKDFIYIGLYATSTAATPVNETVCVYKTYATTGKWSFTWASAYSRRGNRPIAVLFTAKKYEHNTLDSKPFTYVSYCICPPRSEPYLINMDKSIFIPKIHVTDYELRHVHFDDKTAKIISERTAQFVGSKTYTNSWDDNALEMSDSFTIKSTSIYNWRISKSNIVVKPKISVTANYPKLYVRSSKFIFGEEEKRQILFSEYIKVEENFQHNFKISVPPQSNKVARFYSKTYLVDVKFRGKLVTNFSDGFPKYTDVRGTVNVVITSDFEIKYQ